MDDLYIVRTTWLQNRLICHAIACYHDDLKLLRAHPTYYFVQQDFSTACINCTCILRPSRQYWLLVIRQHAGRPQ